MAAAYRIGIKRAGTKYLESLPGAPRRAIGEAIDALSSDPRPHGCDRLQPPLDRFWRIRVSDYRVLYTIDDSSQSLLVEVIQQRGSVYKSARRKDR